MTAPASKAKVNRRKTAGVTIPLFTLRSASSWGIGEIGDLAPFAAWMKEAAGIGLVQILPLGEISGGDSSPYGALTAFGMEPMYLSLGRVPELAGREAEALGQDGLADLARAKASTRIDYRAVRAVKARALAFAAGRFLEEELPNGTARARAFLAFVEEEKEWLSDYALFRALKDAHGGVAWWDWEPGVRDREAGALDRSRAALSNEITRYAYVQWLCYTQWREARAALRGLRVEVMGDMPFTVARDSVDVWSSRKDFKVHGSVGAPPDAFDDQGQDWDLPPYDWEELARTHESRLRKRSRHMGELFDRFRIDHLVGFYRTYQRPHDGRRDDKGKLVPGVFDPSDAGAQLENGGRVVGAMVEAAKSVSAKLIAEDLGVVPDAVRASITALGVPGYRVLIWEKDDKAFRNPRRYPALSVACFGTHDTAPVAVWWNGLGAEERAELLKLPELAKRSKTLGPSFDDDVHVALFELLASAASELVLFMWQDLAGSTDRINVPSTTGEGNWSLRLPASLEDLRGDPVLGARLSRVRAVLEKAKRTESTRAPIGGSKAPRVG